MHIQVVQEQLVTLWRGGPGCLSVPAKVVALHHPSKGPRQLLALLAQLEEALSPCGLYLMGSLPASPSWERGRALAAAQPQYRAQS